MAGAPTGGRGGPRVLVHADESCLGNDSSKPSPGGNAALIEAPAGDSVRSEEHTSELQSRLHLVCRLLLEKKKKQTNDLELYRLVARSYAMRVHRFECVH